MSRKRGAQQIKTLVNYSHADFFDGSRQGGKLKRHYVSMQAHKGVRGFSMDTPFLKIGKRFFQYEIFFKKW